MYLKLISLEIIFEVFQVFEVCVASRCKNKNEKRFNKLCTL